jgi:hypothetical protein
VLSANATIRECFDDASLHTLSDPSKYLGAAALVARYVAPVPMKNR